MRQSWLAVTLALVATGGWAESPDQHLVIGPEQVWIEFIDPVEFMWIGPNRYERTQVLSGDNLEIAAFSTDADSLALLGARAIVAKRTGTHSCDVGDPLEYYVVTLSPVLATDGPLTTCVELVVSLTSGGIVLEEDPMGEGEFSAWLPGQGFRERLK